MASLAELYGQAATSYGKARAKARQIPANLRESGKGLASWAVDPYGEAQRVMGEYRTMTPEQRQGLVNAAVDLFGGVDVGPVGAIKASHGGPHLFDRFDFSKIGTGEGAQAYGHGGYFAQGFDSPVAKEYRDRLSGDSTWTFHDSSNNPIDLYEILQNRNLRTTLQKTNGDIDATIAKANELQKTIPGTQGAEAALRDIGVLEQLKQSGGLHRPEGHLYNVELRWPDAAREAADPLSEHHLLDWDAPLSKQPEYVKTKWADIAKEYGVPLDENEFIGHTVMRAMLEPELAKRGIPGIRYLNQASRGYSDVFNVGAPVDDFGPYTPYYTQAAANEALKELQKYFPNAEIRKQNNPQTRNYVMFDDRFPNIVTRNGVSITDLLKNR